MELSKLKDKIIKSEFIKLPLNIINGGSDYLIRSYIDAIANNKNLQIKYILNEYEIEEIRDNIFDTFNYLFVIENKERKVLQENEIKGEEVIIIYDKAPETTIFDSVIIPKPENQHVEEHITNRLKGLNNFEPKWLCSIANHNVDRLDLEALKLEIFEEKDRKKVFNEILDDNGYEDLSSETIFNLSNAIMRKDKAIIAGIIRNINHIDIEGTGLLTILLRQFRLLIHIQTAKRISAKDIGITDKQLVAISKNRGTFSDEELLRIYTFLTGIDLKLKSGLLDLTNHQLVYYLIAHVFQ